MASRALVFAVLSPLLFAPLALACGGDGGTTTDTAGTTGTTGTTETATTDADTDSIVPTTTAPTTSTTGTGTSDGTTTTITTEPPTTGTSGTTTDTTTAGLDCAAIPAGPIEPLYLGGGYGGSEDLGFDGAGGLA